MHNLHVYIPCMIPLTPDALLTPFAAPKIQAFSEEPWDTVCLAHLFTYQAFNGGVLGLAWVAGEESDAVGGMCQGSKYTCTL